MALTRTALSARIARAERRRTELAKDVEHFDYAARFEGDETDRGKCERAAARAQHRLYSAELNDVDAAIRSDRAALDALTELLQANLFKACRAKEAALDALLEAECDARDHCEDALASEIARARSALVAVGLGTLHDAVARPLLG